MERTPALDSKQYRKCERFLLTAIGQAFGLREGQVRVQMRLIYNRYYLANVYAEGPAGFRPMLPFHTAGETQYETLLLLTFNVAALRIGLKTAGWNSFEPTRELTPSSTPI